MLLKCRRVTVTEIVGTNSHLMNVLWFACCCYNKYDCNSIGLLLHVWLLWSLLVVHTKFMCFTFILEETTSDTRILIQIYPIPSSEYSIIKNTAVLYVEWLLNYTHKPLDNYKQQYNNINRVSSLSFSTLLNFLLTKKMNTTPLVFLTPPKSTNSCTL